MVDVIPDQPRKGRGTTDNVPSRYDKFGRVRIDDGWISPQPDNPNPLPKTVFIEDTSRSIIASNDSPDIPFDRSINPYRGCEHGCVYCFARRTHSYLDLSPGLDFETKILFKPRAPELLEAVWRKPGYRAQTIAMGSNTDPYQQGEREHRITRRLLELFAAYRHPVSIVTKSALVLRDIDLLKPMAAQGLVQVAISITGFDAKMSRLMEPRASSPARRLDAIKKLSQAEIPTAVLASPMIPALNDSELDEIIERAAQAGAMAAGTLLLRLPDEVAPIFEEWLRHHYPDRAAKVLGLIRECRGGKLYQSQFGTRMRGTGVYAGLLRRRFDAACRRARLGSRLARLDSSRFIIPDDPIFLPPEQGQTQLRLL